MSLWPSARITYRHFVESSSNPKDTGTKEHVSSDRATPSSRLVREHACVGPAWLMPPPKYFMLELPRETDMIGDEASRMHKETVCRTLLPWSSYLSQGSLEGEDEECNFSVQLHRDKR